MDNVHETPHETTAPESVRIWDIPTRIFHWGLVICFVGSVVSAKMLNFVVHQYFGYTILALLVFRLIWGIIGSQPSRFSNFVRGPRHVIHHIRDFIRPGRTTHVERTHNPLGGWVVLVFFALLLFSAMSGWFANDGELFQGPLAQYISYEFSDRISGMHHDISDIILILAIIHTLTILVYYIWKRDNLLTAMLTGKKRLAAGQAYDRTVWFVPTAKGLIAMVVVGLVVAGLVFMFR
ncbi:MAG: cytochrome b/b6 domain-containing protein [Actinomycetia bacterium]|nr:cytochrome b/b6 domain-containing protein [Actinomycetes bacterium]